MLRNQTLQVYREDLELSCFSLNCVLVPSLPLPFGAPAESLARCLPSLFSFPFICPCAKFLHSALFLPPSFPFLLFFWPRAEPPISFEKAQYFAALLAGIVSAGRANPSGVERCGAAPSCGRSPTQAPGAREGLARLAEVERSEP